MLRAPIINGGDFFIPSRAAPAYNRPRIPLREASMKRLLLALPLFALVLPAGAADWPNWLGPARNGTSPETGLLTNWPAAGPQVLWKGPGGDGCSSGAVVGNRALTLVPPEGGLARGR